MQTYSLKNKAKGKEVPPGGRRAAVARASASSTEVKGEGGSQDKGGKRKGGAEGEREYKKRQRALRGDETITSGEEGEHV